MNSNTRKHSIQFNFIMNFLLSASSILFPLITVPYVSRILLPEGTGRVAWAISIVAYFTMIAMLGIPTYGIKAVASVREDESKLATTVAELLSINLVMGVLSYGLFLICLFTIGKMEQQKELFLVCSMAIWLNCLGVNWFYQGMEQYGYIAVASILMKILALVLMFAAIHSREDYLWYGITSTISSCGSYAVNFIRLPFCINFRLVKKLSFHLHWKAVLTFFAMSVATTVYTNLDTVMLGFIHGDYQTGLYNEAIKIKTLLVTLITSLGAVLLPRMSAYYQKGWLDEFYGLFAKAASFVILAALPLSTFFMAFSSHVLWILSGPSYLPAWPAMVLLMPTVLLIGLSNLSGIEVLVPMNQENKVLISVGAGALFNLALNSVLIPYFGAAGAAAATLLAEFLVLAIQIYFLKDILKTLLDHLQWKHALQAWLISLPALLIALILNPYNSSPFGIWGAFLCGAALYFGIYALFLFSRRDALFVELWNRILGRWLKIEPGKQS